MANFGYYDILQQGLPEDLRVARLVHGVSWTAAVLSDGKVGVAMHTAGDAVPRVFDSLVGRSLHEAGRALLSWNMEEASEALAAVNAFYNAVDCPCAAPESKTLDGIDMQGRTVGMIGKMIGHSNMTEESFAAVKKLYIMDREDKPGAMPDSAAEFYLPLCDLVIITGSAAINKTLPRLLELSRNAQVILGIDRLHGRIITQKDAMLEAIVGKRTSVNSYSVPFLLEAANGGHAAETRRKETVS